MLQIREYPVEYYYLVAVCFTLLFVMALWGLRHLWRSGVHRSVLWWLLLLPGVLTWLSFCVPAVWDVLEHSKSPVAHVLLTFLWLVLMRLPFGFFFLGGTVTLFHRQAPKGVRVLAWVLLPALFVAFQGMPHVGDCGCDLNDTFYQQMFSGALMPENSTGRELTFMIQWGQVLWFWIIGGLALKRRWRPENDC